MHTIDECMEVYRLIVYRSVIDLINSSRCLKVSANYQSCH